MGRDDKNSGRGGPGMKRVPEAPRGNMARKQAGAPGRAAASDVGRSGYGSESVRPHLRAQLRLKELLGSAFTPVLNPWDTARNRRKTRSR